MKPFPAPALPRSLPAGQRGSSLIEVLVAILITSLGILGLIGLQAKATSYSVSAEDRTRAALLANEAVNMVLLTGSVTLDSAWTAGWQERIANTAAGGLPEGEGKVTADVANKRALITISWRLPSAPADAPKSQLTTITAL